MERECAPPHGRCVVAFSLYGDDSRYTAGVLANARSLYGGGGGGGGTTGSDRHVFRHWSMRLYHDATVATDLLEALRMLGVELVNASRWTDPTDRTEQSGSVGLMGTGRAWRFMVAADPTVTRFLVRDVDSRLGAREEAAVAAWVASGAAFHTMRDHPSHSLLARSGFRIQAGMWGAVGGAMLDMEARLRAAGTAHDFTADARFLQANVWPVAMSSGLVQVKSNIKYCESNFE